MNAPSLKKMVIYSVSKSIPTLESLKDNDIVLVTAAGIISGRLGVEADKLTAGNFLGNMCESITEIYRETHKLEGNIPGNDGFIVLENVTIQNGATHTKMTSLVVFFDQIIGMSFGIARPE